MHWVSDKFIKGLKGKSLFLLEKCGLSVVERHVRVENYYNIELLACLFHGRFLRIPYLHGRGAFHVI